MSTVPVAIVGASGYTGAELIRLLVGHPNVEIVALYARRAAGSSLADIYPQFTGRLDLPVEAFDPDAVAAVAKVAFAALPHKASAEACAALRQRGVKVVDLSADFRLDPAAYAQWYGDHPAPELMADAAYGLPERHREAIRGASLVAAPGCYPTAAILPIAPLIEAGVALPTGLIVDAKSGASGAGRSPGQATHFPEAAEGIRAYKVAGTHRHTPEMEQELSRAAGAPLKLTFTPHLVPMSRGIFACVYATPGPNIGDAQSVLERAYESEPFVSVLPAGKVPDTAHVRGSNRAHVAVAVDERAGRVVAMSAIDNLVKGSAGQAVQCLNLMQGWDETLALDAVALFP